MVDTIAEVKHDWMRDAVGLDPRDYPVVATGAPAGTNGASGNAEPSGGGGQNDGGGGGEPSSTRVGAAGGGPGDGAAGGGPGSPSAASAGSSLVGNAVVQALAKKMDEDGEAADTAWKSQTADDVFALLDPAVHTGYDADGASCDKARGDFNAAWNAVVLGAGSPEKLLAAWNIYSLRIAALQMSNARVASLMTIKAAQQLAAFGIFVGQLAKALLAIDLSTRLKGLKKAIEAAQTQLHKAELKLVLNVITTVITTVIVPEATLAKIGLAVGGFVVHIAIGKGLGSGAADGSVVVKAGTGVKAVTGIAGPFVADVEKYGVTGRQGLGSLKGAIDLALDGLEISGDIKILNDLKSQLSVIETAFDNLMAGLTPLGAQFQAQEAALKVLDGLVAKAIQDGNSALQDYTELQRQIEQAIKSGA